MQVLNRPLDELSALLGFDIPSTPLIDLASIKSDGAIVHWTLPEKPKQKSQLKYEIHLNGTVIDSASIQESAVTITGLQPASFYVVRVALVNNNDFSSRSPAVRFRTKPANSGESFGISFDGHETDQDGAQEMAPRIRPYRALKDINAPSPVSTPMTREGSTGLMLRNQSSRRLSPAASTVEGKHDPYSEDGEPPEGAETIQQLTEKLDDLRRETDETERSAKDEEEEEQEQKEELTRERDELRIEATEKEKASRNLKREVNNLERQNTAAQNERAKQERLLQQKKQERRKLEEDMIRWDREVAEMKAFVERISEEKVTHLERVSREKEQLREQQSEEASNVQELDNEVKEKTTEVKKLERALKNNSPDGTQPESSLVRQLQQDAEEERNWQTRRHALQQQYQMAYNKVESAKRFHAEQMRYLESIRSERRRQDEMTQYMTSNSQQERVPRRGDSQRSRNAQNHSISESPRLASRPTNHSPFASSMSSISPGFGAGSFLNIHNGMTIAAPTDSLAMSEEDAEKLTGGAPMSPGAGVSLLPADLFSGDGDNKGAELVQPLPGLGALPGLPGFPGSPTTQPSSDPVEPVPASPAASSSRSPSVFASPGASQHNLYIGSPEHIIDADRRSLHSTRSGRATSGGTGSRFSGMFGIKSRTKTMSEEGPPLSKASSLPRSDQAGAPDLDAKSRKRNSSISGAVFEDQMGRDLDGTSDSRAAPSRRAFGLFNTHRSNGWPSNFAPFGRRPASPRPNSTHSNELPRPSIDNSRWGVDTWQPNDVPAGARGSPLAFGPGWNPPPSQQQRFYGSHQTSRRPSLQFPSCPPEDIMEDEDSDALDPDEISQLAPIGTKPPAGSKKAESAGKLNPNAKDFKSFFSGIKFSKDRGAKDAADKSDAGTPLASASTTPHIANADIDESPPNSRKSRDTRSFTTTETTESSLAESGRNSADLVRTPSYSNSDAAAPSPPLAGSSKETFMQKITRKSSSSKFSLPTFKREKSRLDPSTASSASTPTVPAEEDEDDDMLSASVSSVRDAEATAARESKEAHRGSRSWSSVLKLGGMKKKGAAETASVSGNSMTSGAEEADDDEE